MPERCGIKLRQAVHCPDLQLHSLFGHDQQRALLFARLAQDQLRHTPRVGLTR